MNNEPFGLYTTSGAEAISNDRELKFILRRELTFFGAMENETYTSYCFVKDGSGWQQTANTSQYPSVNAFVKAVSGFPGFTRAADEFRETKMNIDS